jgi:hypothetical protein
MIGCFHDYPLKISLTSITTIIIAKPVPMTSRPVVSTLNKLTLSPPLFFVFSFCESRP